MIILTHDHFNSFIKKCSKTQGKNFFYFFLFLIKKMENNNDDIIGKKLRIMITVKNFKEEIALHGNKTTEKELRPLKRAINFHEELAHDEDQDDIDYLIGRIIYLENLFNDFTIKNNNTDQIEEEPK